MMQTDERRVVSAFDVLLPNKGYDNEDTIDDGQHRKGKQHAQNRKVVKSRNEDRRSQHHIDDDENREFLFGHIASF